MVNNRTTLLTQINAIRKEIDALLDFVISLEENQSVQQTPALQPEPDEWLTPKQVCKRLNISYTTFFEWVRQGKLPQGIEFSARAKRWRISDIINWREEKETDAIPVKVIVSEPVKKRRGRPPKTLKTSKIRRREEFI